MVHILHSRLNGAKRNDPKRLNRVGTANEPLPASRFHFARLRRQEQRGTRLSAQLEQTIQLIGHHTSRVLCSARGLIESQLIWAISAIATQQTVPQKATATRTQIRN
ncbi:hypothetical protein CBOM_01853 [Ceraceosorus bombacis]|uniref:Uncharacterized protein n=1 Tax=Ceraceosorus bombacis TaxID=401625 RepID=A0A0N7L9J6_9BASI|nr:hypothetical protein CBOM_01853 [Ceraceosorus bombacis]